VEQLGAHLARHPLRPGQVLAQLVADVGIVEVGHRRRGDDPTAGDVVQVAHHQVEVGRAQVFRGVGVEVVGIVVALRGDVRVADRRLHTRAQIRCVDHHLVDLLPDVGDPGGAVGLGDELGQTHHLVGLLDHDRGAAEALPQTE
jgi:hypothetical protein